MMSNSNSRCAVSREASGHWRWLAILPVIMLTACGGSGGDTGPSASTDPSNQITVNGNGQPVTPGDNSLDDECSIAALNQWVDDGMRDYYYFYDQVPVLNLNDYASPEELIVDLRVQPFDNFSYVTDTVTQQNLFDAGRSFGFGYRWRRDANGVPRLARVYPDSPMGRAGLGRGDVINSVGGIGWDELSSEQFGALIGTQENPQTAVWNFTDLATGVARDVSLTMAEYAVDTVLEAQVIEWPDYPGKIGYLLFTAFLETSAAELDEAFAQFQAAGVDELILDLRYNGGGRVSIARKIASLIGGSATEGQLLTRYQFNDKYTNSNFSYQFEPEAQALDLSRVVVLTTGSTASSSELVMNALAPYVEVIGMGSTTRGKPYISYAVENCSKSMNALSAEGFNANDVSVYGGIPATCGAVDEPTRPFGVPDGVTDLGQIDAMLASGLDYIVSGECQTPVLAVSQRRTSEPLRRDPGSAITGALEVRR